MTMEAVAEPQDDILARAVSGDQEAFADLVRQHQRMVFSVAWNFFSDRSLAEDLAQDVFVQLFQNLASIESESHLLFWLRQVTVRKCIDHHRWRAKRRHVSLEDWKETGDWRETGEAGETSDLLALGRVRSLVGALPEKFRAVVVLRYQEELTPDEISATLGWPVNTVKSRLFRALKTLRERMEK